MSTVFISYFLLLCIGYLIRDFVKSFKLNQVMDEDKRKLEEIRISFPSDKELHMKEEFENLKSLYRLQGHAEVIERLFGLF